MLRQAKLAALRVAAASGVSRLMRDSWWRRQRLLILCYHGVSRYDEHEWDGGLYITAERLRRRMELLTQENCNVLPLAEAVQRLQSGSLPPRAVTITFDDGYHDFYSTAFPIIESFNFPVTLYLTTYYVEYNRPVFDLMCSYLLWKARLQGSLHWPEVLSNPCTLDDAGRQAATAAIKEFALSRKLSGGEKDQLLARLAERLDIDYADLCARRVLHLITTEEARILAARGLDLEYHTHRHRVYRGRARMFAELDDNRRRLEAYTAQTPRHFCYTGGFYLQEHLEYLAAYGMHSATTCFSGLCTARTHPLLLPRFLDTMTVSDLEFRSWLSGAASLLPRRVQAMSEGQLIEDEISASV
jgi:peptidoglycan/xylan/chitin deacetylase (PgdA/CDA1 family)